MTDAATIAGHYIDTWNATDAEARRMLLTQRWSADARYVDPMASAEGGAQIDALIGAVQARFPGWRFALRGTPDAHGEHLRFSWTLGPAGVEPPIEGTDVVTLDDGRIGRVIGFLDKLPAV